MKKCRACKNDIEDDSAFCRFCGTSQDSRKLAGVIIQECEHCGGTGECKRGGTMNKVHSCPYCIAKSGIKGGLFPLVPCAYCEKGFRVIQTKQQDKKPKKGQKEGD